ncbi:MULTISPECIES: outer membrane beta-barrel protein [unclassified Saccharicrinis]|uniref:outer membrane beta-barrel protein n=1 Tax=unclassified Saccharicrinis TaxID=2646859 RepID=UPI003D327BD0
MKTIIISVVTFFLITISINAQPLTFEQQDIGIAVGVPSMNDNMYTSQSPAITIHYEYGLSDKIGMGYIGVGGLLSMAGGEYNNSILNTSFSVDYSQTLIGPRAVYHFDMVDLTGSQEWRNIDVYGGAFLGLKFERAKYTNPNTQNNVKDNDTTLATDLFAGIRYGFNKNIGAFAELGFGVSYFSVGVNWRL